MRSFARMAGLLRMAASMIVGVEEVVEKRAGDASPSCRLLMLVSSLSVQLPPLSVVA